MQAVGEALGLGRTFPEALLKALEGVESGDALPRDPGAAPVLRGRARVDPGRRAASSRTSGDVAAAKRFGLPDAPDRAHPRRRPRRRCEAAAPLPGRLAVDSCAGEFEARTPYYYLSYEAGRRRRAGRPARSSCSARARTGSARGSSSTTAASGRRRRSAGSVTRSCSSTRTRRPSRPTTTRATASTSSR